MSLLYSLGFIRLCCVSITLFLACSFLEATAASVYWNGSVDSDWNNASNWTGGLPNNSDEVHVNFAAYSGAKVHPQINATSLFAPKAMYIENQGQLTITTGAILSVGGDLNIDADAELIVNGGITSIDESIMIDGTLARMNVYGGQVLVQVDMNIENGGRYFQDQSVGTSSLEIGNNLNTINHFSIFTLANGTASVQGDMQFFGMSTLNNCQTACYADNGTLTISGDMVFEGINDSTFVNIDGADVIIHGDMRSVNGLINLSLNSGKLTVKGDLTQDVYLGMKGVITQKGGELIFDDASRWYNSCDFIATNGKVVFGGNTRLYRTDGAWQFNDVEISGILNQDEPGHINVIGDWNNIDGTFIHGNNEVRFTGSADQTITHTGFEAYHDMLVNKPAGNLNVNSNVQVSGHLELTDGIVNTSSAGMISMQSASTSSMGTAASHVNGPMEKVGNTDFTFPVGKNGTLAQISATDLSSSNTFQAEFFDTAYVNTIGKESSIVNVSLYAYWNLERVAGTSDATVELFWNDADAQAIDDLLDLKVVQYDLVHTLWRDYQNGGTTGGVGAGISGSVFAGTPTNSFGPFTFGSGSGNSNPLPVDLITFGAEVMDAQTVDITWITATEINSDFYWVEKSQDGIKFETVGEVTAAGNSSTLQAYQLTDSRPFSGQSYYRLKQVDLDGSTTIYDPVSVEVYLEDVLFFPSVAHPGETIMVSGVESSNTAFLYDMHGSRIAQFDLNELETQQIQLPADIQSGVYLVQMDQATIQRLIVR